MGGCSCSCHSKGPEKASASPQAEKKSYVCYQCNTFKDAPATEPAPECCGKKMNEMD